MKEIVLKSCFTFFLFIMFLYAHPFDVAQGSNKGWKAGVASVVITPENSMWMSGYGGRDHPSEGTLHDLWAKVLVFEDDNGRQAVLITSDLEGFPKKMSDRIRDRLETKFNLSRAQIILNSSHTHSGPVLKGPSNIIYPLDSNQMVKIIQYSDKLEDKIVNTVGKALESMEPVQIFSGNGVARFAVNRRNNVESTLNPLTQLVGPVDRSVPVIKVVNNAGDLIAVAFGYACHPTVLSIYHWSGDYAGFAQLELEKLHPGVTALFFQGAGGDQNPLPRKTVSLAHQYGRELVAAVERVLNEDMKKLSPYLSTAYSEVELQFTSPPTREELLKIAEKSSGYKQRWALHLLEKIESGESLITSYPYPIQIWNLGNQLLLSLGGELLIDYTIRFKQLFGEDIFVLGYSNDVMAYIPSIRVLREGGYEGESSQIAWGWPPSTWAANIEMVILNGVLQIAEKAGITLSESKFTVN